MTIDETQEPTLRHGDASPDGWVEYLQDLLNRNLEANGFAPLDRDGIFGQDTQGAVYWFQEANGLQVDGVVGNQTWAALRGEEPQDVGTDGRVPHTFVDKGLEARWWIDNDSMAYNDAHDVILLIAENTGTDVITPSNFSATGEIENANGDRFQIVARMFAEQGGDQAQPGEHFWLAIDNAKATFGTGEVRVRAEMSQELGGDRMDGGVTIP